MEHWVPVKLEGWSKTWPQGALRGCGQWEPVKGSRLGSGKARFALEGAPSGCLRRSSGGTETSVVAVAIVWVSRVSSE